MVDCGASFGLGGSGYRAYIVAKPFIPPLESHWALPNNTALRRDSLCKYKRLQRIRLR